MSNRSLSTETSRSPVAVNHSILNSVPRVSLVPKRQILSAPTKPLIQSKITIGAPNDKNEQEADRVAYQVMCMPDPGAVHTQASQPYIQWLCLECEEELQRKPVDKYM